MEGIFYKNSVKLNFEGKVIKPSNKPYRSILIFITGILVLTMNIRFIRTGHSY